MIRLRLWAKEAKLTWRRVAICAALFPTLSSALVATPSPAQSTPRGSGIHFTSTFAKPGEPVPQDCLRQGTIVQKLLGIYEHPVAWRWIVVCDEPEWTRLQRHVGLQVKLNSEVLAFTNLEVRATCIRGWMVIHPVDNSPEAQPDHTIRHELGHILESSGDENLAERRAKLLLRQKLLTQKMPLAVQQTQIETGQ